MCEYYILKHRCQPDTCAIQTVCGVASGQSEVLLFRIFENLFLTKTVR